MIKLKFFIVALLMAGLVSGDVEKVSPSPAPIEEQYSSPPQSETTMSPSLSPSPFPKASDLNHTDITGMKGETSSGGGKKAGIAFGAIAAATVVGVGGYVLKKRRENIRRARYGYAATEII